MRRSKLQRDKPIPKSDLDQIARFRAELTVYGKLLAAGTTPKEAMTMVWVDARRGTVKP